jgi:hypothetical protein
MKKTAKKHPPKRRPTKAEISKEQKEYSLITKFAHPITYLCKMLDTTPRDLFVRFIHAITNKSLFTDEFLAEAATHFLVLEARIAPFFDEDEKERCIKELQAIGNLWPENWDDDPNIEKKFLILEKDYLEAWRVKWQPIKNKNKERIQVSTK